MFYNPAESLESPFNGSNNLFELVSDENKKKYVCLQPGCGKYFRYKSEIVRHTATHSESRPFVCQYDNCFKAFKRNDALENHIRSSHTKETPFICPVTDCGMKFTTHGSFRYHVLKHNKPVPDSEGSVYTPETPQESFEQPTKHIKMSPPAEMFTMPAQETVNMDQTYMKFGKERFADEFYVQPTRFASSIKWEMVNDEFETSDPVQEAQEVQEAEEVQESQEDKFNAIVEENNVLKEKLATSEKVIESMQKQISELLGSLFAYQSQPQETSQQVLPDLQNSIFQETEPLANQKVEDNMLDMINYGDNFNYNNDNISVDAFLSFDKGFKAFDF